MKWWQSDWYRGEDDCIHMTRFSNNPYHRKGYPKELWNIPMELDGYILKPAEEWVYLYPKQVVSVPVELEPVQEVVYAGSQLALFS